MYQFGNKLRVYDVSFMNGLYSAFNVQCGVNLQQHWLYACLHCSMMRATGRARYRTWWGKCVLEWMTSHVRDHAYVDVRRRMSTLARAITPYFLPSSVQRADQCLTRIAREVRNIFLGLLLSLFQHIRKIAEPSKVGTIFQHTRIHVEPASTTITSPDWI